MLFISIIWNYFDDFPNEICRYLDGSSSIQSVTLLNVDSNLESFIKDVYSCNRIKEEYISKKILDLKCLPFRKVVIISHEISEPDLYYDAENKCYFSKASLDLKEKVRRAFNDQFNCIELAPIIHATDNEQETTEMSRMLRNYYKICSSEIIQRKDWTPS